VHYRVDMADSVLTVSALGTVIGVDLSRLDDSAAQDIEQLWLPAVHSGLVADQVLSVAPPIASTSSGVSTNGYREVASSLSTQVTLAAIELRKSDLLMLHACGVADAEGSVVAFVGPSGRGKTTLAATVARHYGYVSDETVGIDEHGAVYPYRKPLSIIDPDAVDRVKTQVSADELRLGSLPEAPLGIAAIALIDRRSDWDGPPEVVAVSLVEALTQMVPETSYLPELPHPLQRVARLFDVVGGVVRVTYGDSATVPSLVPQLIEARSAAQSWSALTPADPVANTIPGTFARLEVLDGIVADGAYVVLRGRHVRVLDGIGPVIWDALVAPSTLEQISAEVVSKVGLPADGDPRALVSDALSTLVEADLISSPST
jgi:energy-coupling factor transporter ATP-binding protein EcfA2